MYTAAALLDLHTRQQRNLDALLDHCAGLSAEQLTTRLEGFGFPTVAAQLFHMLASESWGVGVLRGEPEVPRRWEDYASVAALRDLQRDVAALTADYLRRSSDAVLNTRASYEVDPGDFEELVPALLFMRLFAHHYHHQGQVLAMCRALGHPRSDETPVDFPLD